LNKFNYLGTSLIKKISVLILVSIIGVTLSGCYLITLSPESAAKQKVAIVGGEYITHAELARMFEPALQRLKAQYGQDFTNSEDGKEMVESQKKDLVNNMIEQKILEQKANEFKIFPNNDEINEGVKKQIDSMVSYYGSEKELDNKLKESGLTQDILKDLIKNKIIEEKVYEYVGKNVTASDEEMKKYYEENKSTMTEKVNTMEVAHILVDGEEEAKAIKSRLNDGEKFDKLAKEKSIDTSSKDKGGNLGEIVYNNPDYDSVFIKAAMSLKVGEISEPVKTSKGYEIIKILKKSEYPIKSFDKMKNQIKDTITNIKKDKLYDDTLNQWKKSIKIKIYNNAL